MSFMIGLLFCFYFLLQQCSFSLDHELMESHAESVFCFWLIEFTSTRSYRSVSDDNSNYNSITGENQLQSFTMKGKKKTFKRLCPHGAMKHTDILLTLPKTKVASLQFLEFEQLPNFRGSLIGLSKSLQDCNIYRASQSPRSPLKKTVMAKCVKFDWHSWDG